MPAHTHHRFCVYWVRDPMAEIELEPENEEEEEEESGLMFLVYRGCITNDKIIL